jgi:hypothetical protein
MSAVNLPPRRLGVPESALSPSARPRQSGGQAPQAQPPLTPAERAEARFLATVEAFRQAAEAPARQGTLAGLMLDYSRPAANPLLTLSDRQLRAELTAVSEGLKDASVDPRLQRSGMLSIARELTLRALLQRQKMASAQEAARRDDPARRPVTNAGPQTPATPGRKP